MGRFRKFARRVFRNGSSLSSAPTDSSNRALHSTQKRPSAGPSSRRSSARHQTSLREAASFFEYPPLTNPPPSPETISLSSLESIEPPTLVVSRPSLQKFKDRFQSLSLNSLPKPSYPSAPRNPKAGSSTPSFRERLHLSQQPTRQGRRDSWLRRDSSYTPTASAKDRRSSNLTPRQLEILESLLPHLSLTIPGFLFPFDQEDLDLAITCAGNTLHNRRAYSDSAGESAGLQHRHSSRNDHFGNDPSRPIQSREAPLTVLLHIIEALEHENEHGRVDLEDMKESGGESMVLREEDWLSVIWRADQRWKDSKSSLEQTPSSRAHKGPDASRSYEAINVAKRPRDAERDLIDMPNIKAVAAWWATIREITPVLDDGAKKENKDEEPLSDMRNNPMLLTGLAHGVGTNSTTEDDGPGKGVLRVVN
ncbi:MAG: hypothetical protein M4579_002701 [Chaenotheca gracillima]|nr:MAG: hypothetical protein M4579_002701 [Chaenotheca gracillima]